VFQVALAILMKLKPFLIWKKYEEIMCLLTGIQSSPQYKVLEKGFIEDTSKVKVTNRMLSQIRREFERLKSRG
jgi:hypothetical protein